MGLGPVVVSHIERTHFLLFLHLDMKSTHGISLVVGFSIASSQSILFEDIQYSILATKNKCHFELSCRTFKGNIFHADADFTSQELLRLLGLFAIKSSTPPWFL